MLGVRTVPPKRNAISCKAGGNLWSFHVTFLLGWYVLFIEHKTEILRLSQVIPNGGQNPSWTCHMPRASIAQKALKRSASDKCSEWDFEQYLYAFLSGVTVQPSRKLKNTARSSGDYSPFQQLLAIYKEGVLNNILSHHCITYTMLTSSFCR